MEDIKVSVFCNAFNHERYIRDALEGFVKQETNFGFEVLIHDDASTDGTADIIREYEQKYPDIIKPIYQTENQYSKGVKISTVFHAPRAKGKYVAVCEGDDYWIDKHKLQKQFDALESHPEIDMCAHGVLTVNSRTGKAFGKIAPSKKDRVLTAEEVIMGDGGYLGTNSLFVRKEIYLNPPKFRQMLAFDYTLQITGSLKGGIYYIAEDMSAYRWESIGSWTTQNQKSAEKRKLMKQKKTDMLNQLDIDTNHKYSEVIRKRIDKFEFDELEFSGKYKELLKGENRAIFKALPLKKKVAIFVKAYFPRVKKLIDKRKV